MLYFSVIKNCISLTYKSEQLIFILHFLTFLVHLFFFYIYNFRFCFVYYRIGFYYFWWTVTKIQLFWFSTYINGIFIFYVNKNIEHINERKHDCSIKVLIFLSNKLFFSLGCIFNVFLVVNAYIFSQKRFGRFLRLIVLTLVS